MAIFLVSSVFAQMGVNPGKKKVVMREGVKTSITINSKLDILSEDFEGGALPVGWTKVDGTCGWMFGANGSSTYWSIPPHTSYAYVNDDACNGTMADVWLITPSMDLTSAAGALLRFESACYFDIFTVKASIDGGTTWSDLQVLTANNTVWTTETISLNSLSGNADVKLAFHYNDNGAWGYGWAIDDVLVYVPEANDLSVVGVVPTFVLAAEDATPAVTVKNEGSAIQNDFDVTVVINDGASDVYTSTKNITAANLAPLATMDVVMDDVWTAVPVGSYTITATVVLAGDAVPANDMMDITCGAVEGVYAFGANGNNSGVFYLNTGIWETSNATASGLRGGTIINGVFYGVNTANNFGYFNSTMNTWTDIGPIGVAGQAFIVSMAYDAINDKIYSIGLAGTYPAFTISFIEIDPVTGAGTIVSTGSVSSCLLAIAGSASGQIYGAVHSDVGNGSFYSIDPITGTMTLIGDMGSNLSSYFQSMAFHPTTDVCYLQAFDDTGLMNGTYTIDVVTGVATGAGVPMAEQMTGFGVPVGPQLVSVTPANGAVDVVLDATVSVTFNVDVTEVDFTGITVTPDPGNVVASIVDNVLTLAHDAFAFNTEYTVFVPAGTVTDGTDELAYDVEWSFTTELDPTSCNDPSDIIFSGIEEFEATVSWTENGAGTQWVVVYGPVGFDPMTEGDQVTVDVTTATLTGLDANTDYEVYVQAICGPLTSGWAGPAAFTTAFDCGAAISTLPYNNAFDVADPCWSIIQSNINQTWNFDATNFAYTCLYDDVDIAAQDEWLISPEFDLSSVSDNLAAKFNWLGSYTWAVDPNENYDMLFKVSTDGTTWATIWDETVAGVFTDWTEYLAVADITAYAGEPSVWFAFNYVGTDGAQWSVLDFAVEIVSGTQNEMSNIVSVYPNPSNGLVNITVTENSSVSVMDVAGRTVAIYNVNANDEVSFTQSAGMYIVKVESNGQVSTHKLVIE